jgi:hypothetical protein
MADQPPIRAELWELQPDGTPLPGSRVPVQFNPETLKVSFANQVQGGDQNGTSAMQYVGKGTTKLAVQLWFDVTGVLPAGLSGATDVRKLTQKVAYFITPKEAKDDPKKMVPPAVRFLWGTFQFDGIVESLEESLEFFSPDGVPLRAAVSLSLTQQNIQFAFAKGAAPSGPRGLKGPGTKPLTPSTAGASLQGLTAGAGKSWQEIASANGIENPRLLPPGQLLDLNPGC